MNGKNQIVYVLSNPAMPGFVKIGKTTQNAVEDRLSQLYSTGVPLPFKCEYAVEVEDCTSVEQALHTAFNPDRINPRREFFNIDPEQAIAILKLLGTQKDVTENITTQLNENVSDVEKESAKKASKRPNMNFREMGIDIGSELVFINDDSIQVKVVEEKKVEYDGEITSLTKANRLVQGLDYNVQPARYWTYKGRNLREIYEETYTLDDI